MKSILRFCRWTLISLGALLLVVLFTPFVPLAARPLRTNWTSVDRGVLIVLSGSTLSYEGNPPTRLIGLNTYLRTVHAIAVWRSGHFRNILLSGEGVEETVKPLLLINGIPESAILIENKSTTTHENALFTKPILAQLPGPYVLLTSDFHMLRASRCFAHEQIPVETLPAPDLFKRYNTRLERWDAFTQLLTEYVQIAWYRAKGWI